MKKFIILLVFLQFAFSSCAVSKVTDKRVLPETGRLIAIERFDMDDHCYLSITIEQSSLVHNKWSTSVVHDPECPCHKKSE